MIAEIQDYAIILLDADGTILSWNAGAEKIKATKKAKSWSEFQSLLHATGSASRPFRTINRPSKKEGRARHIGRRLKKDGTISWGSILITALHEDDDAVIGFTKLIRELADNETS